MRAAVKNAKEKGFSLIIVAIAVLLMGICIQYGVGFFKTETDTERERLTEIKINRLTAMLSAYVQQHERLPCPASPAGGNPANLNFGLEDISAPNATSCTGGRTEGIVPYRTLNIDVTDVKDAWGNYITYAVSPVFVDIQADSNSVYYRCRTAFWQNVTTNTNYDRFKARFCCPSNNTYGVGTDLLITGEPALPRATGNMSSPDTLATSTPPGNTSVDTWAMVLVSHGRNGHGAFLGNGTNNKLTFTGISAAEAENADGDRTFQTTQRRLVKGSNYFDDIIVFMTQSQLYARLSGGTCTIP